MYSSPVPVQDTEQARSSADPAKVVMYDLKVHFVGKGQVWKPGK
jgi:hypothetical protein